MCRRSMHVHVNAFVCIPARGLKPGYQMLPKTRTKKKRKKRRKKTKEKSEEERRNEKCGTQPPSCSYRGLLPGVYPFIVTNNYPVYMLRTRGIVI